MIQGAENPVGQAALQLASSLGAKLPVTVSSDSQRDALIAQYALNPSLVLCSDDDSSVTDGVSSMTGANGVHVYLNCDSRGILDGFASYMSAFGRVVDLHEGVTGDGPWLNRCRLAPRSISYACVQMDDIAQTRVGFLQESFVDVSKRLAAHQLKPLRDIEILGFSQVPEAMIRCRNQTSTYRSMFVLELQENELLLVCLVHTYPLS